MIKMSLYGSPNIELHQMSPNGSIQGHLIQEDTKCHKVNDIKCYVKDLFIPEDTNWSTKT